MASLPSEPGTAVHSTGLQGTTFHQSQQGSHLAQTAREYYYAHLSLKGLNGIPSYLVCTSLVPMLRSARHLREKCW